MQNSYDREFTTLTSNGRRIERGFQKEKEWVNIVCGDTLRGLKGPDSITLQIASMDWNFLFLNHNGSILHY